MSLKFEFRGGGNDPQNEPAPETPDIQNYAAPAPVRHVTLVQQNGECHTWYYHELRKLVFYPEDRKLELTFSFDVVTLNGHNLKKLYAALRDHIVQGIKVVDERYVGTKGEDEVVVTGVSISAVTA